MVSEPKSDNMTYEEAKELLKNVAEGQDVVENVFTQIFVGIDNKPLEKCNKGEMHQFSQTYLLYMEK